MDGAAAVAQFRHDFMQLYRLIDLTPLLVARAMTMAETHGWRGYAAVQLATAMEIHMRGLTLGLPAGITRAKTETLVVPGSLPSHHAPSRTRVRAAAMAICCKAVFACPT
jgi:hypothetical protein